MRCKTEQEDPGCLPDPEAKADGDLRVIVAAREGCPARKAWGKTNGRPGSGESRGPDRIRLTAI